MTLYKWSQTASADATADSTINWAEGQAPSSVNDSARAMMAATAKYRDDIAGAIVTSGTSTAYTVSSYQVFDTLAHLGGQMIAFTPHTTNDATVTLNVDSLGAKPLRSAPGVELLAGTIIQGTPYVAVYNASDGAFYLQGVVGNSYNVPLGAGFDFWGATPPNSSFAFPYGQAISRTAYSALFGLIGTTFGTGDGSTTFNLPDKRGRVSVALDTMGGSAAGRVTTAGSGVNGTVAGSVGGTETITLATPNLPPYTPAGTITNGGITISHNANVFDSNNAGTGGSGGVQPSPASISASQGASTFAGVAQGGTSTPIKIMPPSIVVPYLIRII
jgi:microcystin-dependent protein